MNTDQVSTHNTDDKYTENWDSPQTFTTDWWPLTTQVSDNHLIHYLQLNQNSQNLSLDKWQQDLTKTVGDHVDGRQDH